MGSVGYEWLGMVGTSGTSTPAGRCTGTVPTSTQVTCYQPGLTSLCCRPGNGLHWAVVRREDGERASQQGGGRAAAGRHSQVGGSIESNSLRVKVKAVWGPEREEEQPTEQSLSSLPLLSDPYEERTVEVCTSGVGGGGEGLFAKRQLEEGDLVAIYNGVKVPLVAGVEKEDWEECGYSIGYYETSNSEHGWGDMDIPKAFRSSDSYRLSRIFIIIIDPLLLTPLHTGPPCAIS